MTHRSWILLPVALVLLTSPAPAAAAELGITLDGGWFQMSNARDSAAALFGGSAGGPTLGGSIRLGFARSFFVSGGGRYHRRKGERVFVPEPAGPVFRLGHPLTLRAIPVYGLLGYRFYPRSRLVPYLAGGAGVTSLRETSTVGEITDTRSTSHTSYHLAAGADYGRGTVRLGAEVMYTSVPKSAGIGGVSKVYGEEDVGGVTIVGRVTVGLF